MGKRAGAVEEHCSAKTFLEKRLLTLFLDSSESGKFQSSSRMQQTVDAFVDKYILAGIHQRVNVKYRYILYSA